MDKVNGISLHTHYWSTQKLSRDVVENLIQSAKDCCLYLFDERIYWKDINESNLYIEEGTEALKILDFGFWNLEEDSAKLTYELMIGSMEIIGWILKCSYLRAESENRDQLYPIQFPNSFVGYENKVTQVLSLYAQDYKKGPKGQTIDQAIHERVNDDQRLKEYLASYFDTVLGLFKTHTTQ